MRFFPWVDFQFMAIAFFLGLVAAILAYLAWGGAYAARKRQQAGEESHEEAGHNPVPPLLVLVYTIFAAWALFYVIYVYLTGYRF